MNIADSGVDTGNESNDSSSVQPLDNLFGQINASNVINNNNSNVTTLNENETESGDISTVSLKFLAPPETNHVSLPGTTTVTNAKSGGALISVNSFTGAEVSTVSILT